MDGILRRRRVGRRAARRPAGRGGLLGPDLTGARQALAALAVSSVTATAAGVLLALVTDTLARLPGLLVLVPAAIGMRGNIFGALGSRLSTTIHAGTFRATARADTVVGQNIIAAAVLTLVTGVALGAVAKAVAVTFGLREVIGLDDLVAVSVTGALLASVVVGGVTLALAALTSRRGWDLDNVSAPVISAVGDAVTLPALFVASMLVTPAAAAAEPAAAETAVSAAAVGASSGVPKLDMPVSGVSALGISASGVTAAAVTVVALLAAAAAAGWSWRTRLMTLRRIVRESLPVLLGTGVLLVIAGVVIEHRLVEFAQAPAVLVLIPACLATAGAIGGVLSGRLSSKLHLGVIEPRSVPQRSARRDVIFAFALTVPVFVLNGLLARLAAAAFDLSSPVVWRLVAISLVGGLLATAIAGIIAYYGTVSANRAGVDPDTYGIPLVTSSVDLAGAVALVLAVDWIGLA